MKPNYGLRFFTCIPVWRQLALVQKMSKVSTVDCTLLQRLVAYLAMQRGTGDGDWEGSFLDYLASPHSSPPVSALLLTLAYCKRQDQGVWETFGSIWH